MIEIAGLSLFLLALIGSLIAELCLPDSAIAVWMKENGWDVNKTFISLKSHVPVLVHCLIYRVIIYAVCKIIRLIFSAKMKKSDRTKTMFSLLDGFVKYACACAIIIFILKACGVDTTALVASVGVLTLVVGLGAQPLIADIIAGIFIIFEDEYHVGEIVTINEFRGTVIEIGIRSTKLLDAAGNINQVSGLVDYVTLSEGKTYFHIGEEYYPSEYLDSVVSLDYLEHLVTNGSQMEGNNSAGNTDSNQNNSADQKNDKTEGTEEA